MELWIRSQDKTKLVKVNDVYIDLPYDFGRDTYGVYSSNKNYFENDKPLVLGRYKTKERALEVLDEIQNKMRSYLSEFNDSGITLKEVSTVVYEMPEN